MAYEIRQKVETPLGIGTIVGSKPILYARDVYNVELKTKEGDFYIWFTQGVLKPYRTAHEKLIEMDYELVLENEEDYDKTCMTYKKERETLVIDKYKDRYVLCQGKMYLAASISLELSRILTQYLEELE